MADPDSNVVGEIATLHEAAVFLGVTTTRIIQLLNRNELEPAGPKPPDVKYWPRGAGRVTWEELRRYQAVHSGGRRGRRSTRRRRTSGRVPKSGLEAALLELKIGLDESRQALAVERRANTDMLHRLETAATNFTEGIEALHTALEALIVAAVSDAASLNDHAARLDDLCGRYSAALGQLLTPDDASGLDTTPT